MYDTDVEFQLITFFAYGILFGGISRNIIFSLIFIVIYEFYVFHISRFFPPNVKSIDRILLNLVYIFGWILGRFLMLNESGFEEVVDCFSANI